MIVPQSSRLIAAFCRSPGSPKGCGRLAGDDIPGNQPNDLCALKGRWEESISVVLSHLLRPWHFPKLSKALSGYCQASPSPGSRAFQGCCRIFPNLSKVFQAIPSHFQEKKDCLFFCPPERLRCWGYAIASLTP